MRTQTIDFTGDPLLVHAMHGAVRMPIPLRIRRFSGRKQVVVPPSACATSVGEAVPTALQIALARGHRRLRQIEGAKVQHGHWQPSEGKVLLSGHVSDVTSIQRCLLLRILSDPID